MSSSGESTRRGFLMKVGLLLNGVVGLALSIPILRYVLSPVSRERKSGYDSWLSLGSSARFPAGQTRLATFHNPVCGFLGWRNCGHSLLGAQHRWQDIPGVCHQLRASGMPGALVSAVGPVHVSMPWRCLLSGWRPCLGPSGARII